MTSALVRTSSAAPSPPRRRRSRWTSTMTCDPVHGHHCSCRCSPTTTRDASSRSTLYHVESGAAGGSPAPGQTPSGAEVRTLLKHLAAAHPPALAAHPALFVGADSHTAAGRPWPGARDTRPTTTSRTLSTQVRMRTARHDEVADDLRVRLQAEAAADRMRQLRRLCAYAAGSWSHRAPGRRPAGGVHARLRRPLHRHARSTLASPAIVREASLLRPRSGRKLIKLHKSQLASDRTSCQEAAAPPVQAGPAHRGLLLMSPCAMPCRAGCRSPGPSSSGRQRRACSRSCARDRREGRPRPHPLRRRACPNAPLFRPAGGAPRDLGPLNAIAPCPENPSAVRTPRPPHHNLESRHPKGADTESPTRSKSTDKRPIP